MHRTSCTLTLQLGHPRHGVGFHSFKSNIDENTMFSNDEYSYPKGRCVVVCVFPTLPDSFSVLSESFSEQVRRDL
jgi:hypothetical protein